MWSILLQSSLVAATSGEGLLRRDITASGHHIPAVARRADANPSNYISPISLGGHMYFTFEGQPTTKPEPINIIISGKSSFGGINGSTDYAIFNATGGFSQYLSALNFSDECLGLHLSTPAYANISGPNPQLLDFLYRENFGEYPGGTCKETLLGGYHFRGWRQQESHAFFLAASQELNLTLKHDLVPDGYDLGRDEFVRRASLGGRDYLGCLWPPATITNVTNLVQADAGGPSGMYNHDIGIDGLVSLLDIGAPDCLGNTTYTGKTWSTTTPPKTSAAAPAKTTGATGTTAAPAGISLNAAAQTGVTHVLALSLAILCLGAVVL